MLNLDLSFSFLNRALESTTRYVGEWMDSINDSVSSNLVLIKNAFLRIQKEGTAFKTEITGNDIDTSFDITHARSNIAVNVSIVDTVTGIRMHPEIKTITENTIKVTFLSAIPTGKKLSISIT